MVGKKFLYLALGYVMTALGLVGIWLPGVPTVPFVLVALWAFSHSSPRIHAWLVGIPILRMAIREAERFWEDTTIRLRTKVIAQSFAWMSFLLTLAALSHVGYAPVVVTGLAAALCTVFMVITPTTPESA